MEQKQPFVFDTQVSFADTPDGLVQVQSQEIPAEHVAQLKRDKIDTTHDRMGEFHRVASIPIEVLHKWDREGFVFEDELKSGTKGLQRILNRLKAEHLDAFITTNKRV